LIARFRHGSAPHVEGISGAPFVIYYGQVSVDWAAERRRQASGGLRQIFIASPGTPSVNRPAGDFAVPLIPGAANSI
jgi:hypothetical protein